jgi:hypothetical protein
MRGWWWPDDNSKYYAYVLLYVDDVLVIGHDAYIEQDWLLLQDEACV